MNRNSASWGHVAFPDALAALAMQPAEEDGETAMLRFRYGRKSIARARISLCGFLPATDTVIFNPGTLRDLADIFETDIERAFA